MAGISGNPHDLIETAYAAALDDTLWHSFVDKAIEAFGGIQGNMFVFDEHGPALDSIVAARIHPRMAEEYAAGIGLADPQVRKVNSILKPTVYLDRDHVDWNSQETSDYMFWQQGFGLGAHASLVIPSGNKKAALSIHRSVPDGALTEGDRQWFAALLPAFSNAIELGFRHSAALLQTFWEGFQLGQDSEALFLLDEQGRTIRITQAALEVLRNVGGIDVHANRIACSHGPSHQRLQALIARATSKLDASGGTARIDGLTGGRWLLATAYPIVRERRQLAAFEAAAIVRVSNPFARKIRAASELSEIFGFSPREGELAVCLAQGHSVESAAAAMEIALPTARLHLRRLLAKTGTDRQPQLVRLLTSLP